MASGNITIQGNSNPNQVIINGGQATSFVTINGEIALGGKGDPGVKGDSIKGDTGYGLPAGGVAGQIPIKQSSAPGDYGLTTLPNATGTSQQITKANHGFSKGQIINLTGSGYGLAQADAAANAEVIGMVSQVIDSNTFVVTSGGYVSGLGGLTTGQVYYVSPTTGGNLTATEPTGANQVSKPVFIADSASSGFFFNFRGFVSGAAAGGGSGSATFSTRAANQTGNITSADDAVVGIVTGIVLSLPDATSCTQKPYWVLNNTNGNITLQTVNSQLFEGSTTPLVMAPGQSVRTLPYNGTWIT